MSGLLDQVREPHVRVHVEALVHIDQQFPAVADRLAQRGDTAHVRDTRSWPKASSCNMFQPIAKVASASLTRSSTV